MNKYDIIIIATVRFCLVFITKESTAEMSGCHPVSEFVSMAQSADDDMSEILMLEHKEALDIEMTYQRGEPAKALETAGRMLE